MTGRELIAETFKENGLLKSVNPASYEYRESQEKMASMVADALYNDGSHIIEAPTGVGKSFAYLIPAAVFALEKDEKVVIATDTNTLLSQLEDKDIKAVSTLVETNMQKAVKIACIRGKSNYLCYRRYVDFVNYGTSLFDDPSINDRLRAFILSSRFAAANEIKSKDKFHISRIWSEVNMNDRTDCSDCPHRRTECKYYTRLIPSVASAHLVITNHSLVLCDAKLRYEAYSLGEEKAYETTFALPPYSRLIIDEAHNLPKNCEHTLERQFDPSSLMKLSSMLVSKKHNVFSDLAGSLSGFDSGSASAIVSGLSVFTTAVKNFASVAYAEINKIKKNMSPSDTSGEISLQNVAFSQVFVAAADKITDAFSNLTSLFRLKPDKDSQELFDFVQSIFSQIASELAVLKSITEKSSIFDLPTLFEAEIFTRRDGFPGIRLKALPLFSGKFLGTLLYDKLDSCIWTSATLNAGDDFKFFKDYSGFGKDDKTQTSALSSPFDFKGNVRQFIVKRGGDAGSTAMTKKTADFLSAAINASGGGALVLFSSYRDLTEMFSIISDSGAVSGDITLLCQERNVRADVLTEKFRTDENSVLFATSSFWEGVDFPGRTLRLLIIYKTPFRVPSTPLHTSQEALLMETENKKIFLSYDIPNAVIKLKQGMGRLVRSKTDRGVTVLLDDRLLTRNYGPSIINAIDYGNIIKADFNETLDGIKSFFKKEDNRA